MALLAVLQQIELLSGGAAFVLQDAGDLGGLHGGGNVHMQGAGFAGRQGAEGGLVTKLLAVIQNAHMGTPDRYTENDFQSKYTLFSLHHTYKHFNLRYKKGFTRFSTPYFGYFFKHKKHNHGNSQK